MPAKRVAITGADGFIGSHVAEALVGAGYDVTALVQYNSFNSRGWLDHSDAKLTSQMKIVSGDVRDPQSMRGLVRGADIVMHLASLIAIPYSYHAPSSYVDTNVNGTLNLLQAARDGRVEHIIHTSTSEVYGTAQFVPITEEHPLNAQSPYAATKIAADQLALSFHRSFDMPVSVIRPFNTFGPRQSARAVIPTVISQLLAGKAEIKLGNLEPTRDFTYVEDMAAAFIAMIGVRETIGQVTNFGSGFEISIGDMARAIRDEINPAAEIKLDESRLRPANSEVDRLWASVEKARQRTDWSPSYSGLDGFRMGIEKTVRWFRDSKNLSFYKMDLFNI